MFTFKCDCGNRFSAQKSNVWNKRKDCGCSKPDRSAMRPAGSWSHPLYKTWQHMIDRCENPANRSFKDYGARGIKVCDRWRTGEGGLTGFEAFLADMGAKTDPALTIERDDSNGPYAPGNCRWADRLTQGRNRRGLRLVEIDGETQPVSVWAERSGVPYDTLVRRLKRGVDPKRALIKADMRRMKLR